jgi:hypothetical protein
MAAVLQPNPTIPVSIVMASAILSNRSDSECVSTPFYIPHVFLDCIVGGLLASSEAPTQALIDNSANTVLINPDLVTHLGLIC